MICLDRLILPSFLLRFRTLKRSERTESPKGAFDFISAAKLWTRKSIRYAREEREWIR